MNEIIQETKELLEKVKAKNLASKKQCSKCRYYISRFKDDYTVKHFGYGEIKIRPSCKLRPYSYVSHNPAINCNEYKEK